MSASTLRLTDQERDGALEIDQLKQLVGLVPYDPTTDVFPVTGSIRFVQGGVDPHSALHGHVRVHGDGVSDISLQVPDVDRCIKHARSVGARVLAEPTDLSDAHGTVRVAAIAT